MDNAFFGMILGKTKKWDGSQMLFPIKYAKGVSTVAFNGFDQLPTSQNPVSVNMTFYPCFSAKLIVSPYFNRMKILENVAE